MNSDEWEEITLHVKRDPKTGIAQGQIMYRGELYKRAPPSAMGVGVHKLTQQVIEAQTDEWTWDGDEGFIRSIMNYLAAQGYLQPQPRVEELPERAALIRARKYIVGNGISDNEDHSPTSLAEVEMTVRTLLDNALKQSSPQSGDDAKAEALEDVAYIRKTLGKTWINQMQRERVEEIHARLNKVEAALTTPVKPEKVEGLEGALKYPHLTASLPVLINAARLYATRPSETDIADAIAEVVQELLRPDPFNGSHNQAVKSFAEKLNAVLKKRGL